MADNLYEETSRLLIQPRHKETIPLQTRGGVYVTVCKELKINGSERDMIVGDKNRFLMRDNRYTLTMDQA